MSAALGVSVPGVMRLRVGVLAGADALCATAIDVLSGVSWIPGRSVVVHATSTIWLKTASRIKR